MNRPQAKTLDVRPVEPRFRFETIMGTYQGLAEGDVMELIVDHDPQCMYYTLKAEYGDESFSFDYLEKGPEKWCVRVTKTRE